jgi:transposase
VSIGASDRIEMNQRERDALSVLKTVLSGERSQADAAALLGLSTRQVRRILARLKRHGDRVVVHGLRGKPSNHKAPEQFKKAVLDAYAKSYPGFGPTLAAEKLSQDHGLEVCRETLRRWLLDEGLLDRKRRREPHRSRRPRRACFGELIQMDASIHDWLEGRGEQLVLIAMIDDATSRVLARFYREATVQTHMDLLRLWLRKHGRPLAIYTDRHSIFEPQDKGRAVTQGVTQFGRALCELEVELIRARSPQAKGRVERLFGTAQDRWVKEMRLKDVRTLEQANGTLQTLLVEHNRRLGKKPKSGTDAHRALGPVHDLDSILSVQSERTVSNDYVVRFANRFFQLLPPALPGLRGGKVVVEERLDGTMRIRFGDRYPAYKEITRAVSPGGSAPRPPEFSARAADACAEEEQGPAPSEGGRAGVQPAAGRSGCTPAEPYPPDGGDADSAKTQRRPAENHPWRKPFKRQK